MCVCVPVCACVCVCVCVCFILRKAQLREKKKKTCNLTHRPTDAKEPNNSGGWFIIISFIQQTAAEQVLYDMQLGSEDAC